MANSYVDKEFFQDLSDSELVWHFSSDPNTAMFALDMLKRHQAAAALQMQRIVQAINHASLKMPEEPSISDQLLVKRYFKTARDLYQPIFIEMHFYFVSWVNCQNMVKVLGSFPEFIEANKYFNGVRKYFDDYAEARNTFEHYHDRLPAGKNASKVKETRKDPNAGPSRNYGGLEKGKYTFSDRSWDIGPESLVLLNTIIEEFVSKIVHVVKEKRNELLKQA